MCTAASYETRTWVGSGEGRTNEDWACVSRTCAVLVDGATGLTKAHVTGAASDAAWYARGLCERTVRAIEKGETAIDALEQAGRAVAREFFLLPGARVLDRIDYPNGSAAALRWDSQELELCLLGDCTAVVGVADGTCRVHHDATLDALDHKNYEAMYAYAQANGVSMKVARQAVNPNFMATRLLMNEPGGYWAADVGCRGFGHETCVSYPVGDVSFVVMCSDGFAAATDMGVCASVIELARRVAQGEGKLVGEALRRAEQDDAGCLRVHRSKTSDDATYVLVRFGV